MDEGRNSKMDPKTAEQLGHFRESLEEGRTYEYGERIKSTAKRLAQRGKNGDAMFLLLEGTRDLLARGDFESTVGMVLQVMDIVGTNQQEAVGLTAYFADCYVKMPPVFREKFISKALKLCNTPQLYQAVAETLDREENYVSAAVSYTQSHWLKADDTLRLCASLERVIALGYRSERDLFISRAALHLLCLGKPASAKEVLLRLAPTATPLVNFTRTPHLGFLLQAIEVKNYKLVAYLKEKYDLSLRRDPSLKTYLAHVEKKYFGIEPPREGGLAGLLNLLA